MPHIRHTYVADTKGTSYTVTVTLHVNRDVRVAHQEDELRIYGVPATLFSYVRRVCDVHVKCTRKSVALRRMTYELRIEEYELSMLTYVRRTRDVPFVS